MEETGWDRRSRPEPHLESDMDFAEHQRIVFNAFHLLAGNVTPADNGAGQLILILKEAVESDDVTDVLYISKGIHQPHTNPHITLTLKRKGSHLATYHLNVTLDETPIAGLSEEYFHWVGVQFTVTTGWSSACWPLLADHRNKGSYQRRRISVAPLAVQDTIEAIAKAEQMRLEKEKQEIERQKRADEARARDKERASRRNEIDRQIQLNHYKLGGRSNSAQINKLIENETITVTTKYGYTKKIKLKENTNTVVDA